MNFALSTKLFYRLSKPRSTPKRWLSDIQKSNKPETPAPSQTSQTPQEVIRLSNVRKRMFVFAGLYKNMKDVPDTVSLSTFSRNMDRFRVRASIMLMFIAACGSLSSVLMAKNVLSGIEEDRDKRV